MTGAAAFPTPIGYAPGRTDTTRRANAAARAPVPFHSSFIPALWRRSKHTPAHHSPAPPPASRQAPLPSPQVFHLRQRRRLHLHHRWRLSLHHRPGISTGTTALTSSSAASSSSNPNERPKRHLTLPPSLLSAAHCHLPAGPCGLLPELWRTAGLPATELHSLEFFFTALSLSRSAGTQLTEK